MKIEALRPMEKIHIDSWWFCPYVPSARALALIITAKPLTFQASVAA
jgi:hypothetical protein